MDSLPPHLSRLVYLAPPAPHPRFGSGSVISQFLLHQVYNLGIFSLRDINIISVKLRCLHSMFSLVTVVQGVGGKLSRLVYLAPTQDFGQAVLSANTYYTIILKYLVVEIENIISVKLRCLHPMFSSVTFVRGVGASCPGWFFLPPPFITPKCQNI